MIPPLVAMGDGASAGVSLGDASGGGPPPQANPLLLLAIGGAVAWAHYHFKKHGEEDEGGDEEDDSDDDEDYQEVRAPRRAKPKALPEVSLQGLRKKKKSRRLSDVTTDSLLDEAAVVAGRGKPGDCYKAVKLLKSRAGLVKSAKERGLYSRVARAVSADCAHADDEVEQAIEEEAEILDEVESIFDRRGGSHKASSAAATQKWLEMEADGAEHEGGMRKSKSGRGSRKTTVEHGDARSKGRDKPGRPGAAAIRVKKAGGETFRLRKEKAKTKRGYTWRKEDL